VLPIVFSQNPFYDASPHLTDFERYARIYIGAYMIGKVDYDLAAFCWDEDQVEQVAEYLEQVYRQRYMLSMFGMEEEEE
jgi:hypothetical protein